MYHAHFRGTHYEAGFRWGSLLFEHNRIILEQVPFPITRERMDYAGDCLGVYQSFYPEILEEIQGLADGQRCDVRLLQAVLFSMYAIPPACCCSCFAAVSGQTILLGRNSDFLTAVEKLNLNVIYQLAAPAYSFTGNTTAFIEMEDGVNEYGFAAGLTSVWPSGRKAGFQAGLLLRFLLEKCRNVREALERIKELPVGSAQTLTMADAAGETALAECNGKQTRVLHSFLQEKQFVCAVNQFHISEMQKFNRPEADNWYSGQRFQTLYSALSEKNAGYSTDFAKELLSGKRGFLCQYDRSTGKDTVWSVIYDLSQKKIYRAEGNPGRRRFREDTRFLFRD